jgi:hypothetical protein
MWKAFFEVSFATAVVLAVGSLTSPKRIPWWIAIPIFAFGLFALAMWLHDAAHVTVVGHLIDARRERQHQARVAELRAKGDRVRAAQKEKADAGEAIRRERAEAEAEVDPILWRAGHYHAMRGTEWTVALVLDPPRGFHPGLVSTGTAECTVRFEDTEYRCTSASEVQGRLGCTLGFPQDFETDLPWPLPAGQYHVNWAPNFECLWTQDGFVINEHGHLDGRPFGFR